jgi:hypothetical protein
MVVNLDKVKGNKGVGVKVGVLEPVAVGVAVGTQVTIFVTEPEFSDPPE